MKTKQESAMAMAKALDSGEFPEDLEPQQVAWLLRELAAETAKLGEGVVKLTRGNTLLLDALMNMVNQFFYSKGQDGSYDNDGMILAHAHMSAEESAISVLLEAGMAIPHPYGYVLLWDALAARKRAERDMPG